MKIYEPIDKLNFGKNKGYSLKDIYKYQPSYIEWLILNVDDFAINIEAFSALPKPTPISYGFVKGTNEYKKMMNDKKSTLLERLTKTDQNQLLSMDNIFELLESGSDVKELDYKFPVDVIFTNSQKLKT